MENKRKNEKRAELFLKEVAPLLSQYELKWRKYFKEIGLAFDIDILNDTVLKCYNTIARLGCKDGQKQSMNYLFKAFKQNSIRELQYARNKYREMVDDVEALGDQFESSQTDYKIAKDLWIEFQFNYILREVELMFNKKDFYLFKLKYVLQLPDAEILKKTKNKKWKKDLKEITKYLKNNVKKSDIKADFAIKYPEVDLSIL